MDITTGRTISTGFSGIFLPNLFIFVTTTARPRPTIFGFKTSPSSTSPTTTKSDDVEESTMKASSEIVSISRTTNEDPGNLGTSKVTLPSFFPSTIPDEEMVVDTIMPTEEEENIGSNLNAGEPGDYDMDADYIRQDEVSEVPFDTSDLTPATVTSTASIPKDFSEAESLGTGKPARGSTVPSIITVRPSLPSQT